MFSWFCLEIIGCCFGHSELAIRLRPSGQIPQTKTTTSDLETKTWKRMLRNHYSLIQTCWNSHRFVHPILFSDFLRIAFEMFISFQILFKFGQINNMDISCFPHPQHTYYSCSPLSQMTCPIPDIPVYKERELTHWSKQFHFVICHVFNFGLKGHINDFWPDLIHFLFYSIWTGIIRTVYFQSLSKYYVAVLILDVKVHIKSVRRLKRGKFVFYSR